METTEMKERERVFKHEFSLSLSFSCTLSISCYPSVSPSRFLFLFRSLNHSFLRLNCGFWTDWTPFIIDLAIHILIYCALHRMCACFNSKRNCYYALCDQYISFFLPFFIFFFSQHSFISKCKLNTTACSLAEVIQMAWCLNNSNVAIYVLFAHSIARHNISSLPYIYSQKCDYWFIWLHTKSSRKINHLFELQQNTGIEVFWSWSEQNSLIFSWSCYEQQTSLPANFLCPEKCF